MTHLKLCYFITVSKHRNLVTRFVRDGDGDGDVTNLKLPIINVFLRSLTTELEYSRTPPLAVTNGCRYLQSIAADAWKMHIWRSRFEQSFSRGGSPIPRIRFAPSALANRGYAALSQIRGSAPGVTQAQ